MDPRGKAAKRGLRTCWGSIQIADLAQQHAARHRLQLGAKAHLANLHANVKTFNNLTKDRVAGGAEVIPK